MQEKKLRYLIFPPPNFIRKLTSLSIILMMAEFESVLDLVTSVFKDTLYIQAVLVITFSEFSPSKMRFAI